MNLNLLLRVACLFAYLMAAARLGGLLPGQWFAQSPWVAAALLGVHAVELPLFFRHVRRYRGPLAVSVVLTLLFGLLHWKPLADAQAQVARQDSGSA